MHCGRTHNMMYITMRSVLIVTLIWCGIAAAATAAAATTAAATETAPKANARCVEDVLIAAGHRCAFVAGNQDATTTTVRLGIGAVKAQCEGCLDALSAVPVGEDCAEAFALLVDGMQTDCYVCTELASERACAKKRVCHWADATSQCRARDLKNALTVAAVATASVVEGAGDGPSDVQRQRRRVEQVLGSPVVESVVVKRTVNLVPVPLVRAPIPTLRLQLPPLHIPPPPVDTCQSTLLRSADRLCQQNDGTLARFSALSLLQKRAMCSVCLSSMVSTYAGACSSFALVQASFVTSCKVALCPAVPTTPHAPVPTPAPTLGPQTCSAVLLQIAGAICGQSLVTIDVGGMSSHQCQATCSFCLAAVLSLAAGPCNAFAALQASFSAKCTICKPQTPVPTSAPTVPPPTTTHPSITAAPTVPATPAPTACTSSLLQIAGSVCGYSLAAVDINTMSAAQCAVLCKFCLSAVLSVSAGSCSTFVFFQATFSFKCQQFITAPPITLVPTTTTAAPTTTIAQQTSAPTVSATPAPTSTTPPTCEKVLLQLSGSLCGQSLISFNMSCLTYEQCQLACSFCLTTVLTFSAGPCSSFASIQASFSAQCANSCASQATTTLAPSTATPEPTQPQVTIAPTLAATPSPTAPPSCDETLLHYAGLECGTSLTFLRTTNVSSSNCHTVCTTCISGILALPSCDCCEYARIQTSVVQQCQACLAAVPVSSSSGQS